MGDGGCAGAADRTVYRDGRVDSEDLTPFWRPPIRGEVGLAEDQVNAWGGEAKKDLILPPIVVIVSAMVTKLGE